MSSGLDVRRADEVFGTDTSLLMPESTVYIMEDSNSAANRPDLYDGKLDSGIGPFRDGYTVEMKNITS